MNIPLRLLLCFLVVEVAYGSVLSYAPYILVFATLVDLEHLPHLLRRRGTPSPGKRAWAARSRFHELYGLILLSSGIAICGLFYGCVVIQVIALSALLHAATDFLLGRTRPLYPFSNREVFLRDSVSSRQGDAAHVHHNKLGLVRLVRGIIDQVLLWLPLPRVNPNHISGLTIITSLLFVLVLRYSYAAALALPPQRSSLTGSTASSPRSTTSVPRRDTSSTWRPTGFLKASCLCPSSFPGSTSFC